AGAGLPRLERGRDLVEDLAVDGVGRRPAERDRSPPVLVRDRQGAEHHFGQAVPRTRQAELACRSSAGMRTVRTRRAAGRVTSPRAPFSASTSVLVMVGGTV